MPFGPMRPTRSPKWTSSEKGKNRSPMATSTMFTTLRAESAPRRATVICWSGTGGGGGPLATNFSHRVSAALALVAFLKLEAARAFMTFMCLKSRRSSWSQRLTASPSSA